MVVRMHGYQRWHDDGTRMYSTDSYFTAHSMYCIDVLTGLPAYVEYCGYSVANVYSQYVDVYSTAHSLSDGFTYDDYVAEIEAGRPVLLGYTGHSMLGVGYQEDGELIEFYNTWDNEVHTVAWGDQYGGMDIEYVVSVELATVPEPAACAFALGGAVLMMVFRKRRSLRGMREAA
jgi:hypothetical protein